jgi:membrane-bound lytic murein transglycosylase B
VLPGGEPANAHVRELLERLERPEGEGLPVSRAELENFLERSGGRVDEEDLLRYAAPGSVRRQNFDHAAYARRLMRKSRVREGIRFMREHDGLLRRAEGRYGVARQDIVAILMWESSLGKVTGDSRVFNLLMAQLLFLEDARVRAVEKLLAQGGDETAAAPSEDAVRRRFEKLKQRAVSNLTALLRLSKARGQDPTALRGSWAGAIGYPQFMPASMKYAVDGDGDGVIDLHHWPDAIMSVASYLAAHGYDMSYAGRKRGLFRYNPIDSYVHGVIRYADALVGR